MTASSLSEFLPCDDCGRPDVCEKLGECNLLIPPAVEPRPLLCIPPMPEGFTDRTAWDAIHWRFSEPGTVLDAAVIGWQRDNQARVKAAMEAQRAS